jgi:hypothetical protein
MIAAATTKRQKIDVSAGTGPSCNLIAHHVRPQTKTTIVNSDAFKSRLGRRCGVSTRGGTANSSPAADESDRGSIRDASGRQGARRRVRRCFPVRATQCFDIE